MALEGKNADYLICVCKKKTLGEVRDLIREHHITDLKTLCEKADIGNKCAAKCSMSFCRRKCKGSAGSFASLRITSEANQQKRFRS